ncbi:MAG: hypothetical protein RSB59_05940 [Clostridia bacterium]
MFANNWYMFLLIVMMVFSGDGEITRTESTVMIAILGALCMSCCCNGESEENSGCGCGGSNNNRSNLDDDDDGVRFRDDDGVRFRDRDNRSRDDDDFEFSRATDRARRAV